MKGLLQRLAEGEVLLSDSAMGTFLETQGLRPGECPESWCITHPEIVRGIAEANIAAGSEIIATNSFGANSLRLRSYGLAHKVAEYNSASVTLAKATIGSKGYVVASLGPTGHILREEGGDVSAEEVYEAYKEQAIVLAAGGVDAICLETMSSLQEAMLGIKAVRENTSLPVICTFTFQARPRGFSTVMGVQPERAAREAVRAGADIIGTNCGDGISNMIPVAREMRAACPETPILVQSNAGSPVLENGKSVYKESPEYMASRVPELLEVGANIIGGCCGTTPEHIAAMAKALRATRARY